MIFGTRHTGLVVRDIEKSLEFYQGTLGLKLIHRTIEEGHFIEKIVGLPLVKLEWAKLEAADGSLVELLQYHSHPDSGTHKNYPSNRHGCSHIAFDVDNIDALYQLLKKEGIHSNSEPQMSPDGTLKLFYCHDPDGIILEFAGKVKSE